jgi:hypothetical protein
MGFCFCCLIFLCGSLSMFKSRFETNSSILWRVVLMPPISVSMLDILVSMLDILVYMSSILSFRFIRS